VSDGAPGPARPASQAEQAAQAAPVVTPVPPRRRRSRGSRLRLLLVLLAGLLLSLEVVLRVGGFVHLDTGVQTPEQAAFNAAGMFESVDDAELSYRNRPGAVATVAGVEYRHDERGARVLPAAPAGARRVVFLGDSTTYGLGLAAADSLPACTAAALGGAVQPLNFGTCGYGTAQECRLYEREFGGRRGDEVVMLVVFPNDFSRGTFRWDSRSHLMYVDPLPLPHALKGLLWRSATYRALVSWLTSRATARGDLDPLRPGNAEGVLAAVERLARATAADGRKLLVAHLPAMESLDPYLFAEPVAALRGRCEQLGVPFADLLDGFLAEREQQVAAYEAKSGTKLSADFRRGLLSQYWIDNPNDHHLNASATRIAAQQLARALEPLLSGP
jgi:lysophospholipase L1-like esterase